MKIKELLRQYRALDAEIKDIRERHLTEPELSDILDEEMKNITATRREIEVYIANIPDSLVRCIIRYRYIDCMTWGEIAAKLTTDGKGEYSGNTCRMVAERYMKKAPEV